MTDGARAGTRQRWLDPKLLAKLSNLDLLARTVVEGYVSGLHRAPSFGFSQEFAEYRAYVPGDDLRLVDWNVYGRSERLYTKRFFGDTNTQLWLLLDVSRSMAFSSGAVSKLDYAKFVAAAFTYLAARQHDATGLLAFSDGARLLRPAQSGQAAARELYGLLDGATASGGTDWPGAARKLAQLCKKRSLVVVLSDFYGPVQQMSDGLKPLVSGGHDLMLIQVLDRAELEPTLAHTEVFEDLETGAAKAVSPAFLREEYPERLRVFVEELRTMVRTLRGDFLSLATDQPLDTALARYLRLRARRY